MCKSHRNVIENALMLMEFLKNNKPFSQNHHIHLITSKIQHFCHVCLAPAKNVQGHDFATRYVGEKQMNLCIRMTSVDLELHMFFPSELYSTQKTVLTIAPNSI